MVANVSRWEANLEDAVLNTRAWVLQERLLAPRILHFGRDQLIWEGCELTADEMHPQGMLDGTAVRNRTHFKDIDLTSSWNRERFSGVPVDRVPHILLERVKREYARCHLTRSSDKTIALLGIVDRFQRMLKDQCVAGIWRSQLSHQLLWRGVSASYPPNHELTSNQRQFPVSTFSWLSMNCPLGGNETQYFEAQADSNVLIEILDVEAVDKGTPSASHKCLFILSLKGLLIECELELSSKGLFDLWVSSVVFRSDLREIRVFLDR